MATIGTLLTTLGLDTTGFKRALTAVDKDIDFFTKTMVTMSKDASRSFSSLSDSFKVVNTTIGDVRASIWALGADMTKSQKAMSAEVEKTNKRLDTHVKVLRSTRDATREISATNLASTKYLANMNKTLEKGSQEWKQMRVSISQTNTGLKGVRTSVDDLYSRLGKTNVILNNMTTSNKATNRVLRDQAKAMTAATHAMSDFARKQAHASTVAKKHELSLAKVMQVYRNLRTAMLAVAGGVGIGQVVRSLTEANTTMEALTRGFVVATGSMEKAQDMMDWLRGTTNRLGLEFYSIAERMKAFAAASQGTVIEGKGVEDIFRGVLEASRAMGLDIDRTRLSLLALEQMMSKGTVQTEELRRQLGEHLPGAFRLAAEAMGMTTRALNVALKRGEVFADDLLPRLAALLHEKFAKAAMDAADILQSSIARIKTAFMDLKVAISQSAFLDLAKEILNDVSRLLRENQKELIMAADVAVAFGRMFYESAKLAVSILAEFLPALKGIMEGFNGVETAAKSANTELKNVKPPELTDWDKLVLDMAKWGENIIDLLAWAGRSVGAFLKVLILQAISAVKIIGQEFVYLGDLIWDALTLNKNGVAENWKKIVSASFAFEKEIAKSWTEYVNEVSGSLDTLIDDWGAMSNVVGVADKALEKQTETIKTLKNVLTELNKEMQTNTALTPEVKVWEAVNKEAYEGAVDPFATLKQAAGKQVEELQMQNLPYIQYMQELEVIYEAYAEKEEEISRKIDEGVNARTKDILKSVESFQDPLKDYQKAITDINVLMQSGMEFDSERMRSSAISTWISASDSAQEYQFILVELKKDLDNGVISFETYTKRVDEVTKAMEGLNKETSDSELATFANKYLSPMHEFLKTTKLIQKAMAEVSWFGADDGASATEEVFSAWVKAADTAKEYSEILQWLQTELAQGSISEEKYAKRVIETQAAIAKLNQELAKQQELVFAATAFHSLSPMDMLTLDPEWLADPEEWQKAADEREKIEEQLQKELIKLQSTGVEKQMDMLDLKLQHAKEIGADETLIEQIESAKRVRIAQEEAEKVYKFLADGITDFVDLLTGEGDDLAEWWDSLWDRMVGIFLKAVAEMVLAWAVGMKDMSKLSAATQLIGNISGLGNMFGLTGGTNANVLQSIGSTIASSAVGQFVGGLPGMGSIGNMLGSAGSFLFGSTAAPMSVASYTTMGGAALAPSGFSAVAPLSAEASLYAAEGYGAATAATANPGLLSYSPYGAAGSLGYSLLADPLGLPTNGLGSSIGAGAGGMLGAWGASAAITALGIELGATMGSIVPVIGTAIGAVLGGVIGSLFGGSDHTQRRMERGADWLTSFNEVTQIEDLSELAPTMQEFNQPYIYDETTGDFMRRDNNEGSSAALKYTDYKGQAPKSEWMATIATMPDMTVAVANSLTDTGMATKATAEALADFNDEMALTAYYMEDWEEDAQAVAQALLDYNTKLTTLSMQDFIDQMLAGTMSMNELIESATILGFTFQEQLQFMMDDMLLSLLDLDAAFEVSEGNLEALIDTVVSYRDAYQDANEMMQETIKWQESAETMLTALTNGMELTNEETLNMVFLLDQVEKALAGDVAAIEYLTSTDLDGWVKETTGYFDSLAASIDTARLSLQGFTEDQVLSASMAVNMMGYSQSQLPEEQQMSIPSTFDFVRGTMEAGGAVDWSQWEWLVDMFMNPDLDVKAWEQWEKDLGLAEGALTSFVVSVVNGMLAIEAEAKALDDAAREGVNSLGEKLLDDIAKATMSDQDYAAIQLNKEYEGYLSQADEWSSTIGAPLTRLYEIIEEWYGIQSSLINETGMTLAEMEKVGNAWKGFVEGVQNQALNLLVSDANPQDPIERLGIAKSELDSVLGGKSIESYLGSITDPEKQLEAAQNIQDLLTTYLGAAQEAYQTPSGQYQAIFNEVIDSLGALESFGIQQASEYDVMVDQLSVLTSIDFGIQELIELSTGTEAGSGTSIIPGTGGTGTGTADNQMAALTSRYGVDTFTADQVMNNLSWLYAGNSPTALPGVQQGRFTAQQFIDDTAWLADYFGFDASWLRNAFPSAATGMERVPYDMPVNVHKNEAILSPDEAEDWRNGGGLTINNYIYESKDPQATRKLIEDVVVTSLRRGRGRSAVQLSAAGR